VPAEMRERIFDRFVRGEDGAPGIGLGLPIVRALVEAHGGRVWLEERQGGGARFAFSLPVPGSPATAVPGARSGSPRGRR
jgi:signal transduction histidine kinase